MTSSTRSIARSGASMSITATGRPAARAPARRPRRWSIWSPTGSSSRRARAVCDIGCGYGATAQRLAERHGAPRHRRHRLGAQAASAPRAAARARQPRHPPAGLARQRSARRRLRPRLCDREQRAHGRQAALLRRGVPRAEARRPARRLRLARPRRRRARGRSAGCSSRSAARAACPAWATRATTVGSPPSRRLRRPAART